MAAMLCFSQAGAKDVEVVLQERSQAMKSMGGAARTLNQFTRGRGSAEDAAAAVDVIARTAAIIPELFPEGSGKPNIPDSESSALIWQNWDEFTAAARALGERAATLKSALEGGDRNAIEVAIQDIGRSGCGGCHRVFREKR